MAYVRPVLKNTWYFKDSNWAIHIVNELTSIFVALFAFVMLWAVGTLAFGREAYQSFLSTLSGPAMVTFMWLLTIVLFYHTYAWFKVTPKAMPIQKGTEFVPGGQIVAGHWVAWAVLTLIVLFFAGVF